MRLRLVIGAAIVFLFMGSVGSGQGRTEHYSIPFVETGEYVGSCGAFDILTDYTGTLDGVLVFGKDGLPVIETALFKIHGRDVFYNSTDPNKFVLGGPGELASYHFLYEDGILGTIVLRGIPYKVVLPGYGTIFMETGRLVLDAATGEVVSNSGQNQFFDGDVAALCSVLQ